MSADPVIEVRDLTKIYRGGFGQRTVALDGVSFHVGKGEIFGLIGADGAGKTTAFQILAGVLKPTSGTAMVAGTSGYLTQGFSLYSDLSVMENLRYAAGLRRVAEQEFRERSRRYLELFALDRFTERRAGRLSGGMRQKLALCCALIANPEVLLLDEPTTGVDLVSRRDFWEALTALAAEGITIVVATPYLNEAERCDRVALLDGGKVREIGAPAEFRSSAGLEESTLEEAVVSILVRSRGAGGIPPFPGRRAVPPAPHETLLEATHLRKRFGSFEAVKDFSVVLRRGEVYGLLGANGAGKTTAIKMMCGLLAPTGGEVSLLGYRKGLRRAEVRSRIGYMSQKFTLYEDLTISENLEFYASLYGVPDHLRQARKQWALEAAELAGQEHMLTAQLPGGWKQRVAFGAAIMHEPDLILLDEPTSGVDPLARRAMWRMIHELAGTGAAVLVVTHYMEEAEECDRIGFMVAGEILREGPPAEVRGQERSLEEVFLRLIEEQAA